MGWRKRRAEGRGRVKGREGDSHDVAGASSGAAHHRHTALLLLLLLWCRRTVTPNRTIPLAGHVGRGTRF